MFVTYDTVNGADKGTMTVETCEVRVINIWCAKHLHGTRHLCAILHLLLFCAVTSYMTTQSPIVCILMIFMYIYTYECL